MPCFLVRYRLACAHIFPSVFLGACFQRRTQYYPARQTSNTFCHKKVTHFIMRKDLDRNTLKMREIQVGFELESITHVSDCLDLFKSQRKCVEILTAQLTESRDDPEME